ncbi:MAG: DUF4384 domain-containing protein [Actinobacteria bacterium]|nr:DUF4384 domain-containing protein [Actinomycetota bacterium]
MKQKKCIFAIIFFIFLAGICLPSAKSNKTTQPKHSAIVEADGYVYLSEDKTIRQLREQALAAAKREALQKGQTYIKSFTKVENFQLSYDLIQSQAEGYVKILDSKDYGITKDNRYHYWIKAEIEYRLKPPASGAAKTVLTNSAAPLSVSVWTEKTAYKEGDKIKIFLKGNKDFYARVIYIDSKNHILQLIPNQQRKNNFFKGGETIVIPSADDQFELQVSPPFGSEKIVVYASTTPQGKVETATAGKSLYQINSDLTTIAGQTRGVMIKKTSAKAGAEFYETSCLLTTKSDK